MTQIGKVVHLEAENLEATSSAKSRGQAVLSAKRRESGVRVVGAGVFSAGDWAAALHRNGTISLHAAQALFDQGALPTSSELLAFITLPAVFQR